MSLCFHHTGQSSANKGFVVAQVLSDAILKRGQLIAALTEIGLACPPTGMADFSPTEDSIAVDPKYHTLLDLRTILTRFPAVTMPRAHDRDRVRLRGPRGDVAQCKAYISERAAEIAQQHVEVSTGFGRVHPRC